MEAFKSGFGQFNGLMQPFDDSLYTSYNNWHGHFPWTLNSIASPLTSQAPCFTSGNNMAANLAANMATGNHMSNMAGHMTSPYLSYNRDQCSNSLASLRLKAKQHGYTPVTLSACQYANSTMVTGTP